MYLKNILNHKILIYLKIFLNKKMSIPLLSYAYNSQNQRVAGYEVGSDEQPKAYHTESLLSDIDMDNLIHAAYVQIFNEQQLLKSNRQTHLESQLRSNQINVRGFIRGLLLSETFRKRNYEVNNNYRFVEMCIQRVLGREVYGNKETLAWSIVLASKGLNGFIDSLLDSAEYLANFGYDTVPYQRRRILPGRELGNLPFARMPRYGEDYRTKLEAISYFSSTSKYFPRWQWQKPPYPKAAIVAGKIITIGGALFFGAIAIASTLSAWGLISL